MTNSLASKRTENTPEPAYKLASPGCDAIDIQYTVFADVRAIRAEAKQETWGSLCAILTAPPEYDSKAKCLLLKLACFGDKRTDKGSLRTNGNLVELFGIEGDYDAGEVSLADAAKCLEAAGIEAFLYTTPRHKPEYSRWRVLCPLSKPHSPYLHASLVNKLNLALGNILATESATASQSYYFGRVSGVDYLTQHVNGWPLDLVEIGIEQAPDVSQINGLPPQDFELNQVSDETIADLKSALSLNPANGKPWIDPDNRNTWIAVAHDLKCLGDTGLDLWLDWSRHSDKFDDGVNDPWDIWDGCKADRAGYRAVFNKAAAGGWINPRSAAALRAQMTAETREDRTDTGNMAILAQQVQGKLRYVSEIKTWLWWDSQRWNVDQFGSKAQSAALQVAEYYLQKASEIRTMLRNDNLEPKERKHLEKAAASIESWAVACRNKTRIDNMLNLAKVDGRFSIPIDRLDTNPWLLGVDNGVVDLRTGKLCPDARDDYVTKRSPIPYDPDAQAPRFIQFIDEITSKPLFGLNGRDSRPDLASYLQRALGYCLTGSTAEHKMFMAIGDGANGKNVLLDLVQWIMGSHCETLSPEVLMSSRHEGDAERATPGARKLAGVRMAISSESRDGQRLDVSLVKRHTGDGYMTARALHENPFKFIMTHKLWLMTNHKPQLDHMDEALRGRLHLIPFEMSWNRPGHPDPNPKFKDGDKDLPGKLRQEAAGVLAWLIAGAVAYHREGLVPPVQVIGMTRSYFQDQDPMGLWLDTMEACELRQGSPAADLYESFKSFCSDECIDSGQACSSTLFFKKLKARGIEKTKTNKANIYGLRAKGEFELA